MRFAVVNSIYEAALKNKDIVFLTGDLNHVHEKEFRKNIPDQYINVGIAEQNIIGVGGGFAYGQYGNTHCSIEDVAVMRVLPNMKIVAPSNPLEAKVLTAQILNLKGPTYIRIGRGKEPMPEKKYKVHFGKGHYISRGKDVAIFSYGPILTEAEKVVDALGKKKIEATLINMHTIKPLDEKLVLKIVKHTRTIFTIEED